MERSAHQGQPAQNTPASENPDAGATPVLEVRQIHKSFGTQAVLRGVDLKVYDGQVVCLIGPSGSGKSTVLRCINQLEPIDRGQILFKGELVGACLKHGRLYEVSERELAKMRARIGMVFQSFNLFGHMTALENIMAGPVRVKGLSKSVAREKALALLATVGLTDKAAHYPSQLSGGQQQRIAICRALAMEPELLLLDEPTSALDPELVGEVLETIRQLAASGTTMLIVTHELGLVRDIADQVVFMEQGIVTARGNVEEIFSSNELLSLKRFVGRTS